MSWKHPRLKIRFQVRRAYNYQRIAMRREHTIPIIHLSFLSYTRQHFKIHVHTITQDFIGLLDLFEHLLRLLPLTLLHFIRMPF
jgi:hypothetical protein